MKWQFLHKACWAGDAAEVSRLLDAGANPNQIAPGNWRQSPLGRTLEFRITAPKHEGHVETVRVLLQRGADPNLRSTYLDMSPLELALFCGLSPAVELLRDRGALPSPHPAGIDDAWIASASRMPEEAALAELSRSAPHQRRINYVWRRATPLMMAVGHAGHTRVADELIAAGADPNAGTSILHASCDWHFEHLIPAMRYLARHGWNVHASDSDGETALHKAAFLGYTGAIRTLLDLGADPEVRDRQGSTPLDNARAARKAAAVKALTLAVAAAN